MRRSWHLVVMMAAGLGLGGAAAAQDEPQVEPGMAPADETQQDDAEHAAEAATLMRDAVSAFAKVKSLTFKVRTSGVGGLATRSPVVEAAVQMVRDGAGEDPGWKFLCRGTARRSGHTDGDPFATWYDGKTLRTMREQDKTVLESSWDNNKETMDVGAGWALAWVARWNHLVVEPFKDEEAHPKVRLEGEALVEGQPCRVVYVDYSESSDPALYDVWWYLGKDDLLPRRVEMHFIDTGQGDGYAIATMTAMEPGASVEASALALAVPEGYEVKKATEPEGARRRRSAAAPPPPPAGPQAGAPAPDWTLTDDGGKEVKLSALRGKVVVLDFWATWCGPCRMAMPGIQKIHEAYGGKGVQVYGVNCWESGDAAAYMKKEKFTYGLLLKGDDVAVKYGVSGIPAIFVIGKDGKVLLQQVGFSPELEDSLAKVIDEGLAK